MSNIKSYVVRTETSFDVGEHTVRQPAETIYLHAATAEEARTHAEFLLGSGEDIVGVEELT